MAIYRCRKCNFLYIDDEQKVCFEELDDDYSCPRCSCSKKMFTKKELPK